MARKAENPEAEPTDETGQLKSSFRRRLFRMLRWCAALGLVLFGLSNLWLWSSWGTGMVEAELKKRTGQDWEIGSMSWSPWNGVTLYDTQMYQPEEIREYLNEPVVVAEKIRVRPYWMQLARGRVYPETVEIDSPSLTVSVEMLATIASRTVEPTRHSRPQPVPAPQPAPPTVDPPAPDPDKPTPKPPVTTPAQPAPKPPVNVPDRAPAGLPIHLKISHASCRVVCVSKELDVLAFEGLDYDQVLLGEDSESEIRISSLNLLGMADLSDIRQKIIWKRPYLEFEEQTVDLGGVEARAIAQIGLRKSRVGKLPFLVDIVVDRQKIESVPWLEHVAMVVNADELHARARFNGLLHRPDTWRADGMLSARNFSIRERHGNHDIAFAEVDVPVILRQGALRWSGVRFISEDVSIMGNGAISLRDGHLSVMRLVASPEAAAILERGIRGSHIIDDRARWWYDLNTPDRKVRDLVISGPLLEPEIDAGAHYSSLPLVQMLITFYDFIKEEMRESGKDLKALPIPSEKK